MLDSVAQALTANNSDDVTGAGQFAVAPTGALAWLRGAVTPYPEASLATVDREGRVSPLPAPARSYGLAARLSPDERRLAVMVRTLDDAGVWLYDLARGVMTPLASGAEAWIPIWAPDSRRVAFEWLENGRQALAVQPADGSTPPQVIVAGDLTVSSFTPDGRRVAVVRDSKELLTLAVDPNRSDPRRSRAARGRRSAGPRSRPAAGGSPTGPTCPDGSRSTSARTPDKGRPSRCRPTAPGARRGTRTAANSSS